MWKDCWLAVVWKDLVPFRFCASTRNPRLRLFILVVVVTYNEQNVSLPTRWLCGAGSLYRYIEPSKTRKSFLAPLYVFFFLNRRIFFLLSFILHFLAPFVTHTTQQQKKYLKNIIIKRISWAYTQPHHHIWMMGGGGLVKLCWILRWVNVNHWPFSYCVARLFNRLFTLVYFFKCRDLAYYWAIQQLVNLDRR